MNCDKCGKAMPTNLDYCPTCKINAMRNQTGGIKSVPYDNQIKTTQEQHTPPKPEVVKAVTSPPPMPIITSDGKPVESSSPVPLTDPNQ